MPLNQPPSGGCELKHFHLLVAFDTNIQPPSGGCELKQLLLHLLFARLAPAAFGRL